MAQFGDLVRAKALLRSAARGFGPKEEPTRARCVVAEAEITLVSRDLGWVIARPGLAGEGVRCGAGDARTAWRPGERRPCAASGGAPPVADRTPRRSGVQACRASHAPFPPASRAAPTHTGRTWPGTCRGHARRAGIGCEAGRRERDEVPATRCAGWRQAQGTAIRSRRA